MYVAPMNQYMSRVSSLPRLVDVLLEMPSQGWILVSAYYDSRDDLHVTVWRKSITPLGVGIERTGDWLYRWRVVNRTFGGMDTSSHHFTHLGARLHRWLLNLGSDTR